MQTTVPIGPTKDFRLSEEVRSSFRRHGYLKFESVVQQDALSELTANIREQYRRAATEGALFSGGGTRSGHLNCFPGSESRFVYDRLVSSGIIDIVRGLSDVPLGTPNVGCNLNLPGSAPQNDHADGYSDTPFLIVNVAAVDTALDNGAMEVLLNTHQRDLKYWQILLKAPARVRIAMRQGDVLIRTSTLWHRGMPNKTHAARPMLAFTWESGGSTLLDPYSAHQGRITFLPNRYSTDLAGRLRERAFVASPGAGIVYRAVRSLFPG
jgi:ectoine hydroxylase-related dioxygenase (phytanoyl-CoA dioxygenase family)